MRLQRLRCNSPLPSDLGGDSLREKVIHPSGPTNLFRRPGFSTLPDHLFWLHPSLNQDWKCLGASRGSEQLFLEGRCGTSSALCKASMLVPYTSEQDLLGNGAVVKARTPVFIGGAVRWSYQFSSLQSKDRENYIHGLPQLRLSLPL